MSLNSTNRPAGWWAGPSSQRPEAKTRSSRRSPPVPANLSSYRDIDALVDWIGSEQKESVGNEVKIIKPALTPTLAFPFAAPSVSGSLADAGPAAENQTRLLLWSVERGRVHRRSRGRAHSDEGQ